MRVISYKAIREAKEKWSSCSNALDGWYGLITHNEFNNFSELKKIFNSVDKVGIYHVFDIGGNKLRLIANIHFNRQRLYIRSIEDHRTYEIGKWKMR